MRKRFVTGLFACLSAFVFLFGFSACGAETLEVKGKTFVFVSIAGEYPGDATDELKDEWNEIFSGTNGVYKDTLKWIFAEDGTWRQSFPDADDMPRGTYVQNGNVIELTEAGAEDGKGSEDTMAVSGDTIIFKNKFKNEDGSWLLTQIQTFKLFEE